MEIREQITLSHSQSRSRAVIQSVIARDKIKAHTRHNTGVSQSIVSANTVRINRTDVRMKFSFTDEAP